MLSVCDINCAYRCQCVRYGIKCQVWYGCCLLESLLKHDDDKSYDLWLVQRHLMKMGAKLFDPFNISALSSVPKTECRILVHTQDLPLIHHIPNLLRLKRHLVVTFLMFDSLKQIQSNQPRVVFPRAGIVVMDMPTLVSCKSGIMCFTVSPAVSQSTSGETVTVLKR